MAILKDGNQAFGITTPTFSSLIVEDFSLTQPSDSVELQDGDGLDIGRTTIPRAETFTATLQVGSGSTPTVGTEVTYNSDTLILQEVERTESQAEYQRFSVSGYVKIN
jgi:hypothetical protein